MFLAEIISATGILCLFLKFVLICLVLSVNCFRICLKFPAFSSSGCLIMIPNWTNTSCPSSLWKSHVLHFSCSLGVISALCFPTHTKSVLPSPPWRSCKAECSQRRSLASPSWVTFVKYCKRASHFRLSLWALKLGHPVGWLNAESEIPSCCCGRKCSDPLNTASIWHVGKWALTSASWCTFHLSLRGVGG